MTRPAPHKRRARQTRRHLLNRRGFLKTLGAASLAMPFYHLLHGDMRARAAAGQARRMIIFYFPDGVPGVSDRGDASLWDCQGGELDFSLSECLQPLARHRDQCVFLNGLDMGPADSGSHPGGAKKLLTAVDGGFGTSVDQVLAQTVGAGHPHRMLYLGAMANHNNASGDKHISYPSPGQPTAPEDNPMRAFERLFGDAQVNPGQPEDPQAQRARDLKVSVIDGVLADMNDLRGQLGRVDQIKLNQHLEALREVELRIKADADSTAPPPSTCEDPSLLTGGLNESQIYDPARFPTTLRLQIDLMVQAMACDLTRVGTIQASHHTSELIMSRFPETEMHDPGFDMRSHQASHYGPAHDRARREFTDFVAQRRWFAQMFAYLLDQLAARPEGDGTMLDHSLLWLCTEVSDGNTHRHDQMPFVLAGGAGGSLRTGRLLQYPGRRHGDLLTSLCQAMGHDIPSFGQASQGPLPNLLQV